MSSIYKYISLDGAVSVLSNNSVALNNPQNYNDPFDCKVDIDSKDVDKCITIIAEYALSS